MIRHKIRLYPFHTFIFIPFIVLFLYAQNVGQTKAYMTYRTLWTGALLSVTLYGLFYLLFRSRLKTGVFVTFVLFTLFQYGVVYQFFESLYYKGLWPLNNIHRYLIIAYGVMYLVLIWHAKKTKHDFIKINYFLNALLIMLFFFNLVRIMFGSYTGPGQQAGMEKSMSDTIGFDTARPRPDIYYIILDGYANNGVLSKYYQFENTQFTRSLTNKGFVFCDSAFANYYYTSGSLAATLNFNYLQDSLSQNNLIWDNLLFKTLKHNDYKIYHMKSGYAVTSFFKLADGTVRIDGPNEFEKSLFKYTILRLDDLIGVFAHKRLNSQFEKMTDMVALDGKPKFCFMHFVAPHPPYVFDRNGRMRARHQFAEHSWEPKAFYVDQLIYVNRQMEKLTTKILEANPNSVIVIQSDHGPWISGQSRENVFEARSKIFYACYAPQKLSLPSKTSSVNTFRYLFNQLFNTKLDTLPDLYAGRELLMRDPILTKKAAELH